MDFILEFFSMVQRGSISIVHLLAALVGINLAVAWKLLIPMKKKSNEILTKEDGEKLIEKHDTKNEKVVVDITAKLDKIMETIGKMESGEVKLKGELLDVKSDVEQIKQILNQFQGHLMYGRAQGADFGNRELK